MLKSIEESSHILNPSQENYRLPRNGESGRNSLFQEWLHQAVGQYQMVGPEGIHIRHIKHTESVTFNVYVYIYIGIYVYNKS